MRQPGATGGCSVRQRHGSGRAEAPRHRTGPPPGIPGGARTTTELLPAEGREFYPAEGYHQQYLSDTKNPGGYCGLGGTGVKLSTPFETNSGAPCPTGATTTDG